MFAFQIRSNDLFKNCLNTKSDSKRASALLDKVTDPFELCINEAIMHVDDKVLLMLSPHCLVSGDP